MSSLSDRSDTSEPGGAEGSEEESPGVLSDEQPPESPNDSNDIDDTSKNMPWLKVKQIPKIELMKYVVQTNRYFYEIKIVGYGSGYQFFLLLLPSPKFLPSILLSTSYERLR